MAYCLPVSTDDSKVLECRQICQDFVNMCDSYMPEFSRRSKVHMLLHLTEDIMQFGPVSVFCTERQVSYKCILTRAYVTSTCIVQYVLGEPPCAIIYPCPCSSSVCVFVFVTVALTDNTCMYIYCVTMVTTFLAQ